MKITIKKAAKKDTLLTATPSKQWDAETSSA